MDEYSDTKSSYPLLSAVWKYGAPTLSYVPTSIVLYFRAKELITPPPRNDKEFTGEPHVRDEAVVPRKAPDARLIEACKMLARLITEVPRFRDLLDLTAGALASLIQADQLDYQDRGAALPDNYYEKLSDRVAKMAVGTLPPYGRWISGYYFNSALMRLAAVRDQLRKVLTELNNQRPGCIPELPADELQTEGNRLRHQLPGLANERKVTFEEAVGALQAALAIIENHKHVLNDVSLTIPEMRVQPRFRRRRA